jgi:hypothetical protein
MAGQTEDFEGGTVGAAPTTGTIFAGGSVFTTSGSTCLISNARPYAGSKHLRLDIPAGGYSQLWHPGFTTVSYLVQRFYFYATQFPTGGYFNMMAAISNPSIRGAWSADGSSAGAPKAAQRTSGSFFTSSVAAIPTGTWNRAEFIYDNTGTTMRTLIWSGTKLESPNDADAIIDLSHFVSGTVNILAIGPDASMSGSGVIDIDGFAWADSGRLGPLGSFSTLPALKVRRSGAWVNSTNLQVRKSGAWVTPTGVKVRKSGAWVDAV